MESILVGSINPLDRFDRGDIAEEPRERGEFEMGLDGLGISTENIFSAAYTV